MKVTMWGLALAVSFLFSCSGRKPKAVEVQQKKDMDAAPAPEDDSGNIDGLFGDDPGSQDQWDPNDPGGFDPNDPGGFDPNNPNGFDNGFNNGLDNGFNDPNGMNNGFQDPNNPLGNPDPFNPLGPSPDPNGNNNPNSPLGPQGPGSGQTLPNPGAPNPGTPNPGTPNPGTPGNLGNLDINIQDPNFNIETQWDGLSDKVAAGLNVTIQDVQ